MKKDILIQESYVSDLKLKGVNLIIYSLIRSQFKSTLEASLIDLCNFLGNSKPTVIKSIKFLCTADLITKQKGNSTEKNIYKTKK